MPGIAPDLGSQHVDAAVLARARTQTACPIIDGWFPTPAVPFGEPRVVDIPLPYATYMSSFGDDSEPRLNGKNAQREKFFRFYVAGISHEQVVAAIAWIRAQLEGFRVTIPDGREVSLAVVDSSPLIFRDDGAVRPDGKPIFAGLDNYTVRFPIKRT